MDENTIFNPLSPSTEQNQPRVEVPMGQTQESPVVYPQNPPQQPQVVPPLVSQAQLADEKDSGFFSKIPLKGILKGFLGFLVVLVVAFLIIKFVVPRFFPAKSVNVTLTYWGLWEDENTLRPVLDEFQKQNPTIKITYVKQDSKEYKERLTTRIQNGTGPDIFRFHNTWVLQLSSELLPLSKDVIDPVMFQKLYYPVAQTDLVKNGGIYGIPLGIDTLSLFLNTELFQAIGVTVPTNWDDFLKVARQLTVKDETGKIKTAGTALGTFDNITHAPDIISLLMVQNGAKLTDLSGSAKNVSDALAFYTSFAKQPDNVWDLTLDPSILAFSKGNVGMYFGYSWDVFAIKAANPNLSFEVREAPHLFGREMTVASYWAEGISSKSNHKKEALLFMKFLAQKETAISLYTQQSKSRLFGQPYARIDLADSLKGNTLVYPFVKQGSGAVSSFFAGDTHDNGLNDRMNVYLGNAVRSILENTSPESAVETLSSGVSQVLKQYAPQ